MPEELANANRVRELQLKYEEAGRSGAFDIDFGELGPPPHTPEQCALCNCYFTLSWIATLTPQEATLLPYWPNVRESAPRKSMNDKLDRSIMGMASVVGKPYIDYCQYYQRRMEDWRTEPNGPKLLREYGKALAHGAEVEQAPPYEHCDVFSGSKKGILQEPHAYIWREQAVIDWGMMRERIKKFQQETRAKTAAEICPFIKSEIDKEPLAFPAIGPRFSNIERFLRYSEAEDNLDRVLRWRPRQFVKQFMSYCTGREAVSLGHDIGRMGKALKAKL